MPRFMLAAVSAAVLSLGGGGEAAAQAKELDGQTRAKIHALNPGDRIGF